MVVFHAVFYLSVFMRDKNLSVFTGDNFIKYTSYSLKYLPKG